MSKELIFLDRQINGIDNEVKNPSFYRFVKTYENEIFSIFDILKSSSENQELFFRREVQILKKFNLNFFSIIEDEFDYLIAILSILVVKVNVLSEIPRSEDSSEDIFQNSLSLALESDFVINLILKDFCFFLVWLEIYSDRNVGCKIEAGSDLRRLRMNILRLFLILEKNKKIRSQKKWVGKKSLVFFEYDLEIKEFVFVEMYNEPFQIFKKSEEEVYIYINHFTNVFKLFKENTASGFIFRTNTDTVFFKNLLQARAKIDFESLEYFLALRLKKTNYDRNKLFQYYRLLIAQIKKSILEGDNISLSSYSKKLSGLLDIIRINEVLKFKSNEYFYFPPSLCFRGRTYFGSSVSFTYHKEFRYCLYDGDYDPNFSLLPHPLNIKIQEILNKYTYKLENLREFNFNTKKIIIQYGILWVIVSIAEMFKKKLGDQVSLENFIDFGIKVVNEESQIVLDEDYEALKLYSLLKILKEADRDVYKKRLVSKDATASCFQHLVKILGGASEDSMKWCNLNSMETWYDTYSYILNKWKRFSNFSAEEKKLADSFFSRKSIKKPIMTVQYGAKFKICWKYFLESNPAIPKDTEANIRKIFNSFYSFIASDVGILNRRPEEIIFSLKKLGFSVKTIDGAIANLRYYKVKTKQIQITFDQRRITKQEAIISINDNKTKINTSSRANYIHIHDSATARYVVSVVPVLVVHDCFMIDYLSVTFLIAVVNEAMQKVFHDLELNKDFDGKELFSIFIII